VDDALMRFLRAADWSEALQSVEPESLTPDSVDALTTAALAAERRGADTEAARLRRHAAVLDVLHRDGSPAALALATSRLDPREPKDRPGLTAVLGLARTASPDVLAGLVREHPWLLSSVTDAALHRAVGGVVDDGDLVSALALEYRRLLLRAFRRAGPEAVLRSLPSPDNRESRIDRLRAALRDAIRAGDGEEVLLRKLALHDGLVGAPAAEALNSVGASVLLRYRAAGERTDLAFALLAYRTVYGQLGTDSDRVLADHATLNLAGAMSLWEQETGQLTYRNDAIALHREHLARAAADDPLAWSSAVGLAGLLVADARRGRRTALLDEAEAVLAGPLQALAQVDEEQRIIGLIHVVTAHLLRFEWSGRPDTARQALATATEAISRLPVGDPDRRRLAGALNGVVLKTISVHHDAALNDLAVALAALAAETAGQGSAGADMLLARAETLLARYQTGGEPADLQLATETAQQVLDAAEPGSFTALRARIALGRALRHAFTLTGDLATLDAAIEQLHEAVTAQEQSGRAPSAPSAFQNYSGALLDRYQHVRRPGDLDDAIRVATALLESTGRDDPMRLGRVGSLAGALRARYRLRGDRDDLDSAIALLRADPPDAAADLVVRASTGSSLALALRDRFLADGAAEDVREAGRILRTALEQTPAGAPYLEPLLANYLLVLATVTMRDRERDGRDVDDVQLWMADTQRTVLERCRATGDVPGALATVVVPEREYVPDAPDEQDQPDHPPDDPDAAEDDATPRSLLPSRRQTVRLPEFMAVFAQRALTAFDRHIRSGDPVALNEAVAHWRATTAHPEFRVMPREAQRSVAVLAARAAYGQATADGRTVEMIDGLVTAFTLLLSLTDDDGDRAVVSYDLARALLLRHRHSADESDVDRAYDTVAAAVAPLPVGGTTWRRGVRYLAGCVREYLRGGSFPTAHRSRLDRVGALVVALGPAGDAGTWQGVRMTLLEAYRSLATHPDQRLDALTRSSPLLADALAVARQAGDDGLVTLLAKLQDSLVESIEAEEEAEREGERVELSVSDLLAETDDPHEARLRRDRLQMWFDRLDPDTDYDSWHYVALALLVLLHRGEPATEAERQDESLAVAQAVERAAAAHERPDHRSMALRRQQELYLDRIHGLPAENFDRAVAVAERDVGCHRPGSGEWAVSKAQLGFALSRRISAGRPVSGDGDRAARECREAVAALDDSTAPAVRATVHYLYGGVVADSPGAPLADRIEEAIAAYRTALRDQPPGEMAWANTHHQLGLMHAQRRRGNHEENLAVALEHFAEELAVFTRERYPVDWAFAMVSRGNALSQARAGDPRRSAAEAAAAFDAALEVFSREAFPRHWARIKASQGLLAIDADRVGGRPVDPAAALLHLTAALEVYDRDHHPAEWARMHEFLSGGRLLIAADDDVAEMRSAVEDAERSLSVSGLPPVTRAGRLVNLGAALVRLAEAEPADGRAHRTGAAQALEEALTTLDAHGLLADTRSTAINLVEAYSGLGLWNRAAAVYATGISAAERGYAESLLVASRDTEAAGSTRLVRAGVRALVRAGRPGDALLALERGRARWLGESMARDRADLNRLAADHPGLAAEFRQAAELVRQVETAERGAAVQAADGESRERAGEAREALGQRVARIQRLPGYEQFLELPTLPDVQRVVDAGSALTYLLPGDDEGLALIAHRDAGGRFSVSAHPLPELTTGAVARLLLDGGYLAAQVRGGLPAVLAPMLTGLGAMVAPAAAALRDLAPAMVTIVACGQLGVLPVHAATYPVDGGTSCLMAEFTVAFTPSARVLPPRAGAGVPSVLAGVGDPTGDLRFARVELARVAEVFPATDPHRLLYGAAATGAALLSRVRGATYVHLSCHGYYDVAAPLESHLLLAGGERLTLGDLLAEETLRGVRLVVASACQTAISDVVRLPEEAIGLPAGFLRAGAAAVIGTLWPVADRPTSLLMQRFYLYHLVGDPAVDEPTPMEPARALRRAQIWLAGLTVAAVAALESGQSVAPPNDDQTAEKPFAHPYYWAPFVLAGR
jgi:hypothetical protein